MISSTLPLPVQLFWILNYLSWIHTWDRRTDPNGQFKFERSNWVLKRKCDEKKSSLVSKKKLEFSQKKNFFVQIPVQCSWNRILDRFWTRKLDSLTKEKFILSFHFLIILMIILLKRINSKLCQKIWLLWLPMWYTILIIIFWPL